MERETWHDEASGCVSMYGHTPHKCTITIYSVICAAVGAYGIRPELRRFAMLRRWFAVRFMRWRTGRMPCAPTFMAKQIPLKIHLT